MLACHHLVEFGASSSLNWTPALPHVLTCEAKVGECVCTRRVTAVQWGATTWQLLYETKPGGSQMIQTPLQTQTDTLASARLNTLLMCSPHSSSGPVSHFFLSFSLSMLTICVSFLYKEAFKWVVAFFRRTQANFLLAEQWGFRGSYFIQCQTHKWRLGSNLIGIQNNLVVQISVRS